MNETITINGGTWKLIENENTALIHEYIKILGLNEITIRSFFHKNNPNGLIDASIQYKPKSKEYHIQFNKNFDAHKVVHELGHILLDLKTGILKAIKTNIEAIPRNNLRLRFIHFLYNCIEDAFVNYTLMNYPEIVPIFKKRVDITKGVYFSKKLSQEQYIGQYILFYLQHKFIIPGVNVGWINTNLNIFRKEYITTKFSYTNLHSILDTFNSVKDTTDYRQIILLFYKVMKSTNLYSENELKQYLKRKFKI